MTTKKPIVVSFSGGRTSAYMAKLLMEKSKSPLVFVFANTGKEREETLNFSKSKDGLELSKAALIQELETQLKDLQSNEFDCSLQVLPNA